MRNALELSRYIITKCTNDGKPISNLQLQKILYYIQGGFYRKFKRPAFDDEITAWTHGPVVTEVYYEYNNFVASKIKMTLKNDVVHTYDSRELELIDKITENLRRKNPWELVNMTHDEDPWKNGYEYDGEVSNKEIKKWFTKHGEVID